MAEMKSSGVEWIGNIPEEWDSKRLKYATQICNGADYADIEVDEGGFPVMGSGGEFTRASKCCYDKPSLLLGRKGTVDKPLYIDEPFWCVDTMFYTRTRLNADTKYLYYTALNFDFDYYQTSTTLPSMTQRDLGSIIVPLPPLPEQQAIAAFLDDRCGQVDSIVTDLTQQIEILRKYKKALITETVTKGLDNSAPMKDSGIEWIGELPAHWTISKLRYLANVCSGATPSKDVLTYWEGDIPWISSMEVKTDIIEDTSLHISPEAVKSCSTKILPVGTPVMVVRSGILQHTLPIALTGVPATINQDVKAFFFNSQMKPAYFKYYVQGLNDYLLTALCKEKSTVENIDGNLLLSCPIPLPSIAEQKAIIDRLDAQIGEVNRIVTEKERSIETMRQYKKSLIYEYVTGKKRVAG